MDKLFPKMYDRPEGRTIGLGAVYWFVFLVVLPSIMFRFLLPFLNAADYVLIAWFSIAYYGINFLAIVLIFRQYLADSFLNVRLEKKRFLLTVAVASGVLLLVLAALTAIGGLFQWRSLLEHMMYALPFAEMPMWLPAGIMTAVPLWGTLCVTVAVPVVMCCLYYAVAFAPFCVDRPWLAYLVVAVVSAVPRIVGLGAAGFPQDQLVYYLVQLPWHMIACWAYQKADTVWAPICVYAVVDLFGCLRLLALIAI